MAVEMETAVVLVCFASSLLPLSEELSGSSNSRSSIQCLPLTGCNFCADLTRNGIRCVRINELNLPFFLT